MNWLQAALLWYIIGIVSFLTYANFGGAVWPEIFYVWDKVKDVLLFAAAYALCPAKVKPFVRPVLIYAVIRFIWEIISAITGVTINDHRAVNTLFLVMAVVVAVLLIKDIEARWNKLKP